MAKNDLPDSSNDTDDFEDTVLNSEPGGEKEWSSVPASADGETPASVRGSGGGESSGSSGSVDGPPSHADGEDDVPVTELNEAGELIGGRFQVIQMLGKGGMGEVYLVHDRQIEDRKVALKLIRSRWSSDARFRTLFFQEIRSGQEFVSPHVVQVRDCGQLPDGQLFFTMDHIDGESVSRLLRREKQLSAKHALEITKQLLLGLSSGHERGLIHRDIKPRNVMLSARVAKTNENPHGVHVSLLDFGLATLAAKIGEGRGPGTPHYMSPEQAAGQRLDIRSDLFAAGILLFELVSGQRPFSGRTKEEVTSSVIETDPIPLIDNLDGIKKPLKKLLRKALQKEREKRFSSAADFISAIDRLGPLREDEGSPGWVGTLATMTTISTLVLGGILVNDHLNERVDEGLQKVDETVAAREDEQRIRALEGDKVDLERARDELKQTGLQLQADLRDARSGHTEIEAGLQQRITELGDRLDLADRAKEQATVSANTATTEKLGTQIEVDTINRALLDQVEDLFDLIGAERDRYGGPLAYVGNDFDLLIARLRNGSPDRGTLMAANMRKRYETATADMGLAYLEEVEQLARDIEDFQQQDGSRSFTALNRITDRLEDLRSNTRRDPFVRSVTSFPGTTSRMKGRWLGVRAVTEEELAEFVWRRVQEDGPLADDATTEVKLETSADGDAALTPAIEEIANATLIKKAALVRWLQREEKSNTIARTLYGFHLSEELEEQRLADLDAVFGHFGERVQALRQGLEVMAETAQRKIAETSALGDQVYDTVEFLGLYGVAGRIYASALCQSIVDKAYPNVVVDDQLSIEGLRQLPPSLAELADLINEEPTSGTDGTIRYGLLENHTKLVSDLNWLLFARDWYLGSPASTATWRTRFALAELSQPTGRWAAQPWRELLSFQYQLKEHCASLPRFQEHGTASVFRVVDQRDRPMGWNLYRPGTGSNSDSIMRVQVQVNGVSKSEEPSGALADPGSKQLQWKHSTLLTLNDLLPLGEATAFEDWTPPADEELSAFRDQRAPAFSTLDRNRAIETVLIDTYNRRWRPEDGIRCLRINASDGRSYLVHPILGVVEYRAARATSHLIHLQSAKSPIPR